MEAIKKLFFAHQEKLKFLILGCIGLAGFNCLTRPDYNIFIYIYIYYIWHICTLNKELLIREKVNCFYFLSFSICVDLFWIYFWTGKSYHVKDIEKGADILIIFLSFLGMIVKLIVIVAIGFNEWEFIKGSLPSKLLERLNIREELKEDF